MKIFKILKREKDVDQQSYIIWTLPFFIYLSILLFVTSEARIDNLGARINELDPSRINGLLILNFGLALFSMVWIFILSAMRFDLFGQSPYMALWMLLIPAAPVIYLYLVFKKDLYHVKERENM